METYNRLAHGKPKVDVRRFMDPKKLQMLASYYPEFNVVSEEAELAPHPEAAASRMLESKIMLRKFPKSQVLIYDAGGNWYSHVHKSDDDERFVHCCCPILDVRDCARKTKRELNLEVYTRNGNRKSPVQRDTYDDLKGTYCGEKLRFCENKFEDCDWEVPADMYDYDRWMHKWGEHCGYVTGMEVVDVVSLPNYIEFDDYFRSCSSFDMSEPLAFEDYDLTTEVKEYNAFEQAALELTKKTVNIMTKGEGSITAKNYGVSCCDAESSREVSHKNTELYPNRTTIDLKLVSAENLALFDKVCDTFLVDLCTSVASGLQFDKLEEEIELTPDGVCHLGFGFSFVLDFVERKKVWAKIKCIYGIKM
ncbi:unnamed protein product [Sphenostylis stenocarpa]|uniref:Alphavirus-like MT domain-containing protein n=1 Tax=Sphenostylis stenocarpa TaxID=92480 RepID=A0AA86SQ22_9FABA|nr:unnamed protein product [Sphenostylis stenocarpa]